MPSSIGCALNSSRIIGGLLCLLLGFLLSGCSVARLGYTQSAEWTYWWLDGYVDLNAAQSSTLRQDLSNVYEWHRTQELPQLALLLGQLQIQAERDASAAQICQSVNQLKIRLQALLKQAEPGLLRLALQLKPEQHLHLQQQLAKRQKKWRDDWLSDSLAERQDRRIERLIDRSEMFYGKLDSAQRSLFKASVQTSKFDPNLAQADMLRRHQDLLQTLQRMTQGGMDEQRLRQEMLQLLARLIDSPDPAYRNRVEELTQENCQLFAKVHNSRSASQQQKLIETLKDYESDARALMHKPL